MSLGAGDKAYQYALSGAFRSSASRSGYVSSRPFIDIGGVTFPPRTDAMQPGVLYDSITVQDILNERPNTANFSTWQYEPPLGATVTIRLGSTAAYPRFAGTVLDVRQAYETKPRNLRYHVSCIDWGWRLNKLVTVAKYQNQSATAIIQDLMTTWAPTGYTVAHVQANLPPLDEITLTNERLGDCLSRIAARIGGYWYVDYLKALHFFIGDDPSIAQPLPLTPTHPSLDNVSQESDLSQMVTRVHVEGGGGNALVTMPPGAQSIPVDVGAWYEAGGGQVISGPQRITYTTIQGGSGAGSLVGPGVTPGTPITAQPTVGTGIEDGAHHYAYSWVTASGETLPSPVPTPFGAATVVHGLLGPPPAGEGVSTSAPGVTGGNMVNGATYRYKMSLSLDTSANPHGHETLCGLPSPNNPPLNIPTNGSLQIQVFFRLPAGVQSFVVYRTAANGSVYKKLKTVAIPVGLTPGTWVNLGSGYDYAADVTLGQAEPTVSTATLNRSNLSGITVGPTAVTSRRVYRTAHDVIGPLQLLWTLSDNTTTTLLDGASDSTLGAVAPTVDTSGLTMAPGQIAPGATAIITAGANWANSGGGWAVIGNGTQVVRYTGISGNSITGIPSSGPGSIVAGIAYNSTITAAAALEGIPASGAGAIRYEIKQGDPVNLWITVDSASAIAQLASLLGDDGIQVDYIQDRRLSATECRARAQAQLSQRGAPLVTLHYTSRDLTTRAGATITANLPAPTNIVVTLKAQQVTISNFSHLPNHYPTYSVTASTERYSFEDLLRDVARVPH